MTITSRKQHAAQQIIDEPGVQIECDGCSVDLTHSVRIKCAHADCEPGEGVDICPGCFCKGTEFSKHKRDHPYRVVELHSYPIFDEDWGADEELLVLDGLLNGGLGNWEEAAKNVGTRTKEEIKIHYTKTYIDVPTCPLPDTELIFDIDPDEFHARKRRRIEKMAEAPVPGPPPQVVSLPAVHEVAHYLPGRLEFEIEIDNEAEDLIKDLEFGIVTQHGGDDVPEDPNDCDVKARAKWLEERAAAVHQSHSHVNGKTVPGYVNGIVTVDIKSESSTPAPAQGTPAPTSDTRGEEEEEFDPPPYETPESVAFKLAMIDMYHDRIKKRKESKAFVLDRGLLDIKRAKDKEKEVQHKEFVSKYKSFARLQSGDDYELFINGLQYELLLRKRIQNLQEWRRLGLTSAVDVEKYDRERAARTQRQAVDRGYLPPDATSKKDAMALVSRDSLEPHATGSLASQQKRKPLTLSTAPSLHLLNAAEQTLCMQLRMLPRPFLVVKETLIREFARRGGRLKKSDVRSLVRIDTAKAGRIWDLLVMSGMLKVSTVTGNGEDVDAAESQTSTSTASASGQPPSSQASTSTLTNGVDASQPTSHAPPPPSAPPTYLPPPPAQPPALLASSPAPQALPPAPTVPPTVSLASSIPVSAPAPIPAPASAPVHHGYVHSYPPPPSSSAPPLPSAPYPFAAPAPPPPMVNGTGAGHGQSLAGTSPYRPVPTPS